jgi:hypothetical protein
MNTGIQTANGPIDGFSEQIEPLETLDTQSMDTRQIRKNQLINQCQANEWLGSGIN